MNQNQDTVPPPLHPDDTKSPEDKRLWIGNLDPRINELHLCPICVNWYHLLKLMQKHGAIEKFDLLFHRSGQLAGQPRGYAFITYATKAEAAIAKDALHNKLVGSRRLTVTWAHSMNNEEPEKKKPQIDIPALAGAKEVKKASRQTQIQAIEAKLKLMENGSLDEFEINKTVATETPVINQYQQKSTDVNSNANNRHHRYSNRRQNVHPYAKTRRR